MPDTLQAVQNGPSAGPLDCSAVLTHHWLVMRRGGERVLEALGELVPGSAIYTLVHDPAAYPAGEAKIRTSFLQYLPGAKRHYPKLLPLMPLAARRIKLPPVDLVVCSDAAIAKAMTPEPCSRVVCYCHSPMRYIWDMPEVYRATLPRVLRPMWDLLVPRIRRADHRAAQRVDQFVANSRHVAERIKRNYGRESVVIHPPVDLPPSPHEGVREDFYLCVGHHVRYKRLDLAVEACVRLRRELVVIGSGPEADRLRAMSPTSVRFLGWQGDQALQDYYRRARGLLFPGEEDFGIVPVEAQAHGCPVIAYGVGGACETVIHGRTGVLFEEQTVDAMVAAIVACERQSFDPRSLFEHTTPFGRTRFQHEMADLLRGVLKPA